MSITQVLVDSARTFGEYSLDEIRFKCDLSGRLLDHLAPGREAPRLRYTGSDGEPELKLSVCVELRAKTG